MEKMGFTLLFRVQCSLSFQNILLIKDVEVFEKFSSLVFQNIPFNKLSHKYNRVLINGQLSSLKKRLMHFILFKINLEYQAFYIK